MGRPVMISRKLLSELELAVIFPIPGNDVLHYEVMPYLESEQTCESSDGLQPPSSKCNIVVPVPRTLIEYYTSGTKYTMNALVSMQWRTAGCQPIITGMPVFGRDESPDRKSEHCGKENLDSEYRRDKLTSELRLGINMATLLARTCSELL